MLSSSAKVQFLLTKARIFVFVHKEGDYWIGVQSRCETFGTRDNPNGLPPGRIIADGCFFLKSDVCAKKWAQARRLGRPMHKFIEFLLHQRVAGTGLTGYSYYRVQSLGQGFPSMLSRK